MIYRGVKLSEESEKKQSRRDWLKAVGIALLAAAVIAGLVLGLQSLGIQ